MSYVPLWCKSNYSFLEGASHPEELMAQAALLGLPALALTDRNGVYGLPRAHQQVLELKEAGAELRLLCGSQVNVDGVPLVLLVQNAAGWKQLCRLLTVGALRSEKGQNSVTLDEVAGHNRGLLALWGGPDSSLYGADELLWRQQGSVLKEAFGDRLYAMLCRHHAPQESAYEPRAVVRAHRFDIPLLATREVLYHQTSRRQLQDVLTCIRHGVPLARAGRLLKPNDQYGLSAGQEFAELYEGRPEAVRRTLELSARVEFGLEQLRYRYPDEPLPEGKTSAQWLEELVYEGARERYGSELPEPVLRQIRKELAVIIELDYVGYFLTMYEIVRYCRTHDILCQGRGSAANSIVCFCLDVTAVDPIKLNLLFERFISKERAEPPDIDLDITHQRREEVIAWVYQRYGRDKAAMVCNVVRYRARSAVREVGKVMQMEVPAIERLARLLSGFSPGLEEKVLEAAGLDVNSKFYRKVIELINEILDFPRHLSIHPGGFLLGNEPVHDLVPIENATMEGRTVVQWDKYDVDNLGLFKVDLLGLGALSHLDRSFKLLKKHREIDLDMATIPVDDAATFEMLSQGDSVGVFQVESRGRMARLPSMQPRVAYDLVVQVAIVRPGPITGGMVHPYLRRRNGEEEIDYPHPSLKPVLESTLGIPLFQEQVMKIAVVAADYTPGEADQLRRDMAAWKSHGRLERHRERLMNRMIAKGIEPAFAERVFEQIRGFGEYGFPQSHAASFALITYATSYIRCHYPAVFSCALLNSLPMGFYSASTLVEDAKRKGVIVRPFCVERSDWECTLEPAPANSLAIRLGLRFLKGLGEEEARRIEARRPFRDMRDLTVRTGVGRKALDVLSRAGALDCYGRGRRSALWAVDDYLQAYHLPLLADFELEQPRNFPQLSWDEEVIWDFESSGMSSRGHTLKSLRPKLKAAGYLAAERVQKVPDGRRARYAGMVICRQRPATASGVVFLTMEDETGFVNVILWPKVFEQHFVIARSVGFLAVEGKIQSARGVVHLVARKLTHPQLEAPVAVGSRNFH